MLRFVRFVNGPKTSDVLRGSHIRQSVRRTHANNAKISVNYLCVPFAKQF